MASNPECAGDLSVVVSGFRYRGLMALSSGMRDFCGACVGMGMNGDGLRYKVPGDLLWPGRLSMHAGHCALWCSDDGVTCLGCGPGAWSMRISAGLGTLC